ncbi:MAG: response regulator transcription factor [Nitriliruptorales bacterium]|nr:response regulator transcription factor [Nitriliruptorales bacterium]
MIPPAPARILVVEDDAAVRDSLDVALRHEGYEVLPLRHGEEITDALANFRPDLAVLDVRLPQGPDGLSLARRIRADSDLPILFLTAADTLEDRLAGFDAGADDYLTKPFSMAEVKVRIRALLRRSGRLQSDSWQIADLLVDEGARSVTRNGGEIELTPTEFDLLVVLGRHRGRVLTKSRILSLVWGEDAYDPNLVQVHMSSLRRKLEARGPRIIHTVRGVGYLIRRP